MSLLQTLGKGQGWAKIGFLGSPKSGKTWTSILLAIGVKKHFGLPGPLVMFDTEGGSEYIAPLVKRETGSDLIGVRARAFDDLLAVTRECEEIGASVLVVDSITHPWRELCDSYLARLNEVLAARGKDTRSRLELSDWNPIKAKWAPWPDWYLNSKMHVIVCGRAGDIWSREENERTGKMETVKTGVKMKTEGEFGFEPSLLISMEARQTTVGTKRIINTATVLGDRFGLLNGQECENPTFEFFRPFIEALTPNASAPIDVALKSDHTIDGNGDAEWTRERRERAILCEEIQGELLRAWPGQTQEHKTAKLEAIEKAFDTRSWTYVESLASGPLRDGLVTIRELVAAAMVPAPVTEEKKAKPAKTQKEAA